MGLNYILPVAAIPENGREIDNLDDTPELAHRIALVTNPNPWCCQGQHKSSFLSHQSWPLRQ
jgi:3-oxoacyl-ACP reductase-like protein